MEQEAKPGEQDAEPGKQEGRMTARDAQAAWERRAGRHRESRPVERVDPYDMPAPSSDAGDAEREDPASGGYPPMSSMPRA